MSNESGTITEQHRQLMMHALGLTPLWRGAKRVMAHRNYFITSSDGPDKTAWFQLIGEGFAVKLRADYFAVTLAGIRWLGVSEHITCDLLPKENKDADQTI